MSKRIHRVHEADAFLLQATAWSETSVIATLLTRDHGLIAGIAKGAKRPYSVMRPILSHFQPLQISWSGQSEVKTITRAELAGLTILAPRYMMSAWYMNELLLRCLAKEDPHPYLYDEYHLALRLLTQGMDERAVLRRFEWFLLKEIGYGFDQEIPDFNDLSQETALRKMLRERLDSLLEQRELSTRKVVQSLRQM